MAGSEHTGLDLGTIILLTVVVFLDHNQRNGLHFLIGGKAFSAIIAKSAAADGIVVICRSGINYSGILTTTKRTLHAFPPFLSESASPKPQYIDLYYTDFV
jgi:hypothetical protein